MEMKFKPGDVVRSKAHPSDKYKIIKNISLPPEMRNKDERILWLCQSLQGKYKPLMEQDEIEDEYPRPFWISLSYFDGAMIARYGRKTESHTYWVTPSSRKRLERFINHAPVEIVWNEGHAPQFKYKWPER